MRTKVEAFSDKERTRVWELGTPLEKTGPSASPAEVTK
jgi:hypothetical protein